MVKVTECIIAKGEEGIITKSQAKALAKEIEDDATAFAREAGVGEDEALRAVAKRTQEQKTRELERNKRMAIKQIEVQTSIRAGAEQVKAKGLDANVAMRGRLSFDASAKYKGVSLDIAIKREQSKAQEKLAEFLNAFKTTKAGFVQKLDDLHDVAKEAFGESTGNINARQLGKSLMDTNEFQRVRFNAAGGDIVKRENWGLPMRHDSSRVAAVTKDEWRTSTMARLNLDRMLDENGLPMTEKQVWAGLGEAYDEITTRGMNGLKGEIPTPKTRNSSVNRRANSRFLVFKDGQNWIDYQKEFGQGSMYNQLVTGVNGLARDTAILQVLGPRPDATLEFMKRLVDEDLAEQTLKATGKKASKLAKKIGGPKSGLTALFNTTTGRTAMTDGGWLAEMSELNRNVLTSAQLGGAFFSAIAGDPITLAVTAKMNGLSVTKVMGKLLKTFATNSNADRMLAARLGFAIQSWSSRAIGAQRLLGEINGPELSQRMTDTALRLSLLSPFTESGKLAFQLELLGHLSSLIGKQFKNLPKRTQGSFNRHGITEADWNIIRETPQWKDPDSRATFLRAEDIAGGELEGARFDAANRFQDHIFVETEFAVVSSSARVRATLTGGQSADTLWGAIMRNTAMYKSWPISVIQLHYQRGMAEANPANKAQYFAQLLIGMTLMGALGEQLTNVSKGKELRNMDDPDFWRKAAMRGGSLGLFGDVVFQDQNRFGGGLTSLLGPVFGQAQDVSKLTLGNIQQLMSGEDTNAGRELSRFIEQNTPGRSLWYARLAMERLLFDSLDRLLDPKADQAFSRMKRRAKKEDDQRFWSKPGSVNPLGL